MMRIKFRLNKCQSQMGKHSIYAAGKEVNQVYFPITINNVKRGLPIKLTHVTIPTLVLGAYKNCGIFCNLFLLLR